MDHLKCNQFIPKSGIATLISYHGIVQTVALSFTCSSHLTTTFPSTTPRTGIFLSKKERGRAEVMVTPQDLGSFHDQLSN